MNLNRTPLCALAAACFFAAAWPLTAAQAQANAAAGPTIDETIAPGNNYDKANFRLWMPRDVVTMRAILVLVPGSNGDGRSAVDDTVWQAFATRHKVALVGVQLTDKPHPQNFIEHYVNVSQGSGQAFLDALSHFAERSKHPELATAPLLLWGMSAGGQFNYEFVAWKPERVLAFVVNKGGIYYSALVPPAARQVPGILFVGGKDLEFRTNTIVGLFAVNRRAGALWALAEEPGAAHIVGRSRDVALVFYDDMLKLRLDDEPVNAAAATELKPLTEKSGFLGDLKGKTFQPLGDGTVPNYPTAWLPTSRVARAWQALVSEKPFDP
jgi:poly(3-hydroxybutyrate) depolymerase